MHGSRLYVAALLEHRNQHLDRPSNNKHTSVRIRFPERQCFVRRERLLVGTLIAPASNSSPSGLLPNHLVDELQRRRLESLICDERPRALT